MHLYFFKRDVNFFRDGRLVEPNADFKSDFDGRFAKLTINKLTSDKCGSYRCIANSDYGETKTSASVTLDSTGINLRNIKIYRNNRRKSLIIMKSHRVAQTNKFRLYYCY